MGPLDSNATVGSPILRSLKKWTLSAVVVLAAAALVAFVVWKTLPSTPERTFDAFRRTILAGDQAGFRKLVRGPEQQINALCADQFRSRSAPGEREAYLEAIRTTRVAVTVIEGDDATCKIAGNWLGSEELRALQFIREQGTWYVYVGWDRPTLAHIRPGETEAEAAEVNEVTR